LDPGLFYQGAGQQEALARLRFLVEHRRRVGLLLGAPGWGKSLLMKVFADQCRQSDRTVAEVNLLGLTAREFYWRLGCELGAAVRREDDLMRLFSQLADRIAQNRLQTMPTVVFLDDVDQAAPDVLTQLARLARIDAASDGWLTLLLAANPAQAHRLGDPLLELVDLRIDLEPWDEADTIGYLQLALVEAGAQRPLFEDEALAELHHLAAGVPRWVNRLADYALLAGSGQGQERIDVAMVQSAQEAIRWPTPA